MSMSGESCAFAGLMISNTAVYFMFAGSVHFPLSRTHVDSTLSMISSFTPSAHSLKGSIYRGGAQCIAKMNRFRLGYIIPHDALK
jgi:hypothetical protein